MSHVTDSLMTSISWFCNQFFNLIRSIPVPCEMANRTAVQVLPRVVISHNRLRVLVLSDHLYFTIRTPVIQEFCDYGTAQIMRRYSTNTCEFSPAGNDLLDHARTEWLIEDKPAIIDERLKKEGIRSIRVKCAPTQRVEFQIIVNGLFDILRQRPRLLLPSFNFTPENPAPVTPPDG